MLMSELFPTFERPINATSGSFGAGQPLMSLLLITNFADLISMQQS
jgi:hypothetical protein